MTRLLVFLFIVACMAPSSAQQALRFDNVPGPHAVGFRVIEQVDASRRYPEPKAAAPGTQGIRQPTASPRPIQTAIWYPAHEGGRAMRYDDYLALLGSEDDFGRTPAERTRVVSDWLATVTGSGREAQVAAERASVLWAVRDAAPLAGKYPVVVYAPSLSSPAFENAEMMEYLASHGYIVVASPALGVHDRWQRPDIVHARAQAADIRFLVDFARTLPQADADRLAVAGFSFGGLANVVAAAGDARIKALVCLDGTMRYNHQLLTELRLDLSALRMPLLYLAQRPSSLERLIRHKPDLSGSSLEKMTGADVYLLTMYAMDHAHFATSFLRLDPLVFDEYARDEVVRSHAMSARYVLNFLDGALRGRREGFAYLRQRPEQAGMPPHSVHARFFPAQP